MALTTASIVVFFLTAYVMLGLVGGRYIVAGFTISSILVICARAVEVAVAVRAIIFTWGGMRLLTSASLENSTRNLSPLFGITQNKSRVN